MDFENAHPFCLIYFFVDDHSRSEREKFFCSVVINRLHKHLLNVRECITNYSFRIQSSYDKKLKQEAKSHQLLGADWKMKIAVKTPTNAVTAKATVGKGVVSPKFSRSPLPVAISTLIAAAKPTIANRPSHTSKPLPPLALCSHLMETNDLLLSVMFG